MNLNILKLGKFFIVLLAALGFQLSAHAQPVMVPGFMAIESSYIENAGSDSANAYFTITNFDDEPMRILSASGETFESAVVIGPNNETLEYVEILPNERLAMDARGMHIQLSNVSESVMAGETQEVTLLIRRGREAMEAVEAQEGGFAGAFSGPKIREAGIPNEQDYVVRVPVKR